MVTQIDPDMRLSWVGNDEEFLAATESRTGAKVFPFFTELANANVYRHAAGRADLRLFDILARDFRRILLEAKFRGFTYAGFDLVFGHDPDVFLIDQLLKSWEW